MRHGGNILVDQLKLHGVSRVFSVPGESFLAALDGLYDSGIENIVCRHEGAAAMMAEASGKLTGKPGIIFVTRGPGATNASAGLHVAAQDSTPLVMFVGQIARGHRDREAFQEVDYKAFFGSMVKWVAQVEDTDRLPEYINRAFHVAMSGRPGPVVLALPEDMLSGLSEIGPLQPTASSSQGVSNDQIAAIRDFLAPARRPLIVAGGSGWSPKTAQDLQQFAENANLPVCVSFRRQDYIDNRSLAYVGDLGVGMNPKLAKRLGDADRLLILGSRFADIPTGGFELLDPAAPNTAICHVHPDPNLPGTVYRTELTITAQAADVIDLLARKDLTGLGDADWARQARQDYEAWQTLVETPGAVKLEQVVAWLSTNLPEDAVLTNGAGNYAAWLHRYYQFKTYGTQLAPTSGSMGYGFPASLAAKLHNPEKTVVCLAGDGCFQMTLNEMSTARQFGINIIVILVNNGRYGTIRMHQERNFPGRVSGTDLVNPDFVALAQSYGGHGELVEKTDQFPAAFARAVAANQPAVIELRVDKEALSTGQTLSQIRDSASPA